MKYNKYEEIFWIVYDKIFTMPNLKKVTKIILVFINFHLINSLAFFRLNLDKFILCKELNNRICCERKIYKDTSSSLMPE